MLRDDIIKFFIIACNLNKKIVKGHYFNKVMNNDKANYALFNKFASECSSTLLCIMHSLGHCNGNVKLENIIRHHVETRINNRAFFENDAGGYIAAFINQRENREERVERPVNSFQRRVRLSLRRRAEEELESVVSARRPRIEVADVNEAAPRNQQDISAFLSSDDDNAHDNFGEVPSQADEAIFTPLRENEEIAEEMSDEEEREEEETRKVLEREEDTEEEEEEDDYDKDVEGEEEKMEESEDVEEEEAEEEEREREEKEEEEDGVLSLDENEDDKMFLRWSLQTVYLLLEKYEERINEFSLGTKRHFKIWENIACDINKVDPNIGVFAIQCQSKMNSMKRMYFKIINNKSGNDKKLWEYFERMNELCEKSEWPNPKTTVSDAEPLSSANSTDRLKIKKVATKMLENAKLLNKLVNK